MKKSVYLLLCAAAIICTSAFILITNSWRVDPNAASVSFTSDKIDGKFEGLKANIQFDKDHPEQSKISATIDATSVATGFFLKNSHAKDALGVDTYPTIKFVSTSVERSGNAFIAKGQLTMKGATRPAAIHFTFTENGGKGVFKGDFKVIPKEFAIDRAGTPPVVSVTLSVPVNKS